MKNRTFYLKNAGTVLLTVVAISVSVLFSPCLRAQTPYSDESMLTVQPDNNPNAIAMKDFTVRVMENVVYVKYIMKGEDENSVFLFEKSLNNKDYIVISQKGGFKAPNMSTEMLYSFIDPQPFSGTSFYRVLQVKKDGFFYSPTASVHMDEQPPVVLNEGQ